MAGTPTLVITSAGLAAASVSTPVGPFIHITAFKIGSGFGYTPTPDDTSLNGNVVYSGVPSSYQNVGAHTLDILCEIPPNAGPFDFGEVGLYLDGDILFAKAVFPTLQTKYSALGTNVVSSYELNCLLTLAQSTAIFQIDTNNGPPPVLQIFDWADIYPPGISANPATPLLLVKEKSEYGDPTLIANADPSNWSIETIYDRYKTTNGDPTFPVANSSTTWIEVSSGFLQGSDITTISNRFVIKTPDGYFRSVSDVQVSGSNYRFNLNSTPLSTPPAIGSHITIFRDDGVPIETGTGRIEYFAMKKSINPLTNLYANGAVLPRVTYNGLFKALTSTYTGTITAGSNVLTSLVTPNDADIQGGFFVSGPGIPLGATIISFGVVGTITISASATASSTLAPIVISPYQLGDGSTTFNIPDLRGVVPRGYDGGRGLDVGRTIGSYQVDANKAHGHAVIDTGHVHPPLNSFAYSVYNNSSPSSLQGGGPGVFITVPTTGSAFTGISIGSSGDVEARMKNVALYPTIRYR